MCKRIKLRISTPWRWGLKVIAMLLCCLFPLVSINAQPVDTLFRQAQDAFDQRQFDRAYHQFETAGDQYLVEQKLSSFLKCRVEMARCSQFTTVVSRQAIGDIIDPAIKLITEQEELKNSLPAAESFQFLARFQWAVNGEYEAAIESYAQSLQICESIGDSARYFRMSALSDLSHVYSNQEQFDQAVEYAEQALNLSKEIYGEDHVENGPRYYSLGFAYYRKGYFDAAIDEIRKGIQTLEQKDGPEMQIGLGYNNLSAVYVAKLDQEGARQSSLAAEKILSKYLGPDHEALATIYWDLGSMYTDLGQYDLAEENLLKAIAIFEKKFGESYPQLPQLYHQLGFCYDQINQFESAEKWHQKAFYLNFKSFESKHPRTGESYRQLANHYIAVGDLSEAELAISQGLHTVEHAKSQSSILKAGLYEEEAKLWRKKGLYLKSAKAYDQAIESICLDAGSNFCSVDQTFNPLYFTQFNSEKTENLFLAYLAQRDLELLKQALNAARDAHAGIRWLRSSYQSAESKLFLQKRARYHYDLMLEILYQLWENTGENVYFNEAWQISEQSKSILLLEEIKAADLNLSGLPAQTLDSLKNLRRDLDFQRESINELLAYGDSTGLSAKQLKFVRTQNDLVLLENKIDKKYPQYRSLRMDFSPVEVDQLADILPESGVLLEYYLADSALFIFAISENSSWSRIDLEDNFLVFLEGFISEGRNLESIINNPATALALYDEKSSKLFSLLFPDDMLSKVSTGSEIIIVPDQQLGYISFEALKNLRSNKYFIEDFVVSYAYSGTLYRLESEEAENSELKNFAGFAPDYKSLENTSYSNDLALANLYREGRYNLPGAQEEVTKISKMISGSTWLGAEATEAVFREVAPQYSILHLSLHGLIDEEDPMRSRLLFSNQKEAQKSELHAYEIYNLELGANLLVLSACNTAAGSLRSGEGILSLSRAFAFAGVPNLIASLWRADDAATSDIMISFYEALDRGIPKSEALRKAKLGYLYNQKSLTNRHPYFWSSFIMIGENKSTFKAPSSNHWLVGIIIIVVISAFLYLRRKNLKNNPI